MLSPMVIWEETSTSFLSAPRTASRAMQSTGQTFTHMEQLVHVLMSLWRNPRNRFDGSQRSSGYWRVIVSLGSTPYRAVIRIPLAVVAVSSQMSCKYPFKPIPLSEERRDHRGNPLAAEEQKPEGDAQQVEKRERNEVFPRHAHALVHAQPGQGPPDPHHEQDEPQRLPEEHPQGEQVAPGGGERLRGKKREVPPAEAEGGRQRGHDEHV